jgi:hypothetical protein
MIQLKLNWFGNTQARIDELDGSNNNLVTFSFKGKQYNIPETVFNYNKGVNNWLFGIGDEQDAKVMLAYSKYYIDTNGNTGSKSDFTRWANQNNVDIPDLRGVDIMGNWDNFKNSLDTNLNTALQTGVLTPETSEGGKVSAFNQYYQDLYSLEPGTGGAEMLSRLEQGATNQAQQAATLADVNFQQAAMQQAQTVKAITDQVRSERMARLRAGMSESQIANQDMQMLMTNVNTLNQNAQMLNQGRLEAQMGMNLAQDQAYQDYLAQSAQRGQVATGMAASDAGDAYQQTIRQMTTLYGNDPTKWTATQWSSISNQVTGQNQSK